MLLRGVICVWERHLHEEVVELFVMFKEWIGTDRGAGWRWIDVGAVVWQKKRHGRDVTSERATVIALIRGEHV